MRIYYRTGKEIAAGVLRGQIPGHQTYGATTGEELVALMRLYGLRPVLSRTPQDAVLQTVRAATLKGVPPIVRGRWVSPVISHWFLVVQGGKTGWTVNDPWGGRRYFLPAEKILYRYDGDCIL